MCVACDVSFAVHCGQGEEGEGRTVDEAAKAEEEHRHGERRVRRRVHVVQGTCPATTTPAAAVAALALVLGDGWCTQKGDWSGRAAASTRCWWQSVTSCGFDHWFVAEILELPGYLIRTSRRAEE